MAHQITRDRVPDEAPSSSAEILLASGSSKRATAESLGISFWKLQQILAGGTWRAVFLIPNLYTNWP